MDLDKCIKERHSVRTFKSKKPDWRKILEAIDAGNKIPFAGNIPTIKFILVSDKEKIAQIAEAATQDFIATTDYVIVVCSDPSECIKAYEERGEIYSRQQAGAAIENLLLKITDIGLNSCWVGAFSETTIKDRLQIPEDVNVEALLPIGYEIKKTKQRLKPNLDKTLFFDIWKNKYMKPIKKPEAM